MAGQAFKKRSRDDAAKSKTARPSKKQRKQLAYHSDSDEVEDNADDFQAVNLLDSDSEDIENAQVDDVGSTRSGSYSGSGSDSEEDPARVKKPKLRSQNTANAAAPGLEEEAGSDVSDYEYDDDEYDNLDGSDDGSGDGGGNPNATRMSKSKRNDPAAFATSLTKILSTKLSASRRADPVLARSSAAHEASRQALDASLESKARRRLREQKRVAMDKGRVRDVLVASNAVGGGGGENEEEEGEGATTGQIMEAERRLRRVAQRGVVKLFNAVRAAQVKAAEAERAARSGGITGVKGREEKVTEMSRKGFLDLIASGGGGLKKGALEEA